MELTFKVNRSVIWLIIVVLAAAFGWRLYKRSARSQVQGTVAAPEPAPQPVSDVQTARPAAPIAREIPAVEAEQRSGADRRRPVAGAATNRPPRPNPFQPRKSKGEGEARETLEEKMARLDREAMNAGIGAASAIKDQQLRQDQPETAEVFAHAY